MAAVVLFFGVFYFKNTDNNNHSSHLITSSVLTHRNKLNDLEINGQSSNKNSIASQNLVKTYQGTQVDGAVHLDEYNNVIIDHDLKRLFDYYLSAMGELPLDQMRKYLQQFTAEQLNPDQLQQLLDYFDHYQKYLVKADLFSKSMDDNLSLQEKMKLLAQFRLDGLGSEMTNAFYADEQAYIEFLLTEKNSDELSEQQQDWLQAQNQATEFQDVVIENREFNIAENIDASEIYQYRVDKYGQKAADRLSHLDQQRAQWQTVVDGYFQQRRQINNLQADISLEQLNSNYSPQEIRRLEALWRIETGK